MNGPRNPDGVDADLTIFIARNGDDLVTDSRAVALAFGKRHSDVLRAINGMKSSRHGEIRDHHRRKVAPVFFESEGANGALRRMPMYRMTADGLSELAMSFSGDKARVVRIRFIAAFREVARRIEDADRSITKMLHDHDRRAVASETRARIGSLLMHGRRKEKSALKDEEARLREIAQPRLPLALQTH